jgi:Amt family ammonium transporter
MWSSSFLVRIKIDDAVDAIPVHMVNGAWGMLATGLFASPEKLELTYGGSDHPGFFYSFGDGGVNGALLANQILGVLFIAGWAIFTMLPFFIWLNYQYVNGRVDRLM